MSAIGAVSNSHALTSAAGGGNEYTVQHGDSLSQIAAQHGVSVHDLLAANPQIRNPDVIYPGQRLTISGGGHAPAAHTPAAQAPQAAAATSTATPGSQQARINEAMGYFQSQGWTRAQAAGIVGNLQAESGVDSNRGQDGGGPGYGLAQWEGPRQAAFKAWSGHDIHGSTFQEQLQFVQHELTTTEAGAGRALKGATNAADAATIVCNKYERPGVPHLANRIADAQAIFNGSTPTQPGSSGSTPTKPTTPSSPSAPKPSGGGSYIVRSGDSLSSIAAHNGVSLSSLIAANPQISNPNLIFPGQTVHLPGASSSAGGGSYSVRSGDTLSGIAAQHGVSLSSLMGANPQISNPNLIYPGQTVHIPSGGSTARTSEVGGTTTSSPVKGSNAAAVAEKFNGENTSTLKASGALPMNPNTPNDSSCANFVSACLQKAGMLSGGEHTDSVATLNHELRGKGWHPVSMANAKPGDVVIIQGGGASHTEIVASNDNGHITLIGSNNTNADDTQRIGHDTSSWAWNHGGVILAPP